MSSDPEYTITIRSWSRHQKDNTTKFIALKVKMLHDPSIFNLTIGQRWLWVALLLHAGSFGPEYTLSASYMRVAFGLRAGWKHLADMEALKNNNLIKFSCSIDKEIKKEKREAPSVKPSALQEPPPKKTAARSAEELFYPDGLNPKAWARYVEHRRDIKAKKLTDTGAAQAMKKWAESPPQAQMLAVEDSIANGYTGCWPSKFAPGRGKETPLQKLSREMDAQNAHK